MAKKDRTNTESVLTLVLNGDKAKASLKELRDTTRKFTTEFTKMREADDPKLYAKKRDEINKLNATVKEVSMSMRSGTNDAKSFSTQIGDIAKGVFGGNLLTRAWDMAVQGVTGFISKNAELSDSMAGVIKTTGLSEAAVDRLNDTFKKMDTRTAKSELMGLAQVAGKLGFTLEKDVEGFVRAADKIGVALGEDLGGTEDAVKSIGKLVDIFKINESFGLEESILKVGSAINELGSSGTANEKYLIDFTQRMAGIAPAANISMTDILGLGATLDELGQQVEASSTAVGQFIVKMGADIPKFAKIAGISVGDFAKLLKDDANEAFLRVLESSNSAGGGIQKLAENMGMIDVAGARGIAALGVLSSNVDKLREKQALSNSSFVDGTSIIDEFNNVNDNLAGNLEKIKKRLDSIWENSKMREWFTDITAFLAGAKTNFEKLTDAADKQKSKVEELEKSTIPLIDTYHELQGKVNKSKTEHEKLQTTIQRLAETYPLAITQVDEYGNAIGVSTYQIKQLIEAEKLLLKQQNKRAIEEGTNQAEFMKRNLQRLREIIKTGKETTATGHQGGYSVNTRVLNNNDLIARKKEYQEAEEGFRVHQLKMKKIGADVSFVPTQKEMAELRMAETQFDALKEKYTEINELKKKGGVLDAEQMKVMEKYEKAIGTWKDEPIKPVTGGGKKDAKPPKLTEAQKLQVELEKINDDIFLNSLEKADKEVEAMRLKYEKLKIQAKGNEDQLAEIGRLEGEEASNILQKITKETEEETKKQTEIKAKALQEINQKLMTESQLEIDTAKTTYLRLLELADEFGLSKSEIINKWIAEETRIKEAADLKEAELNQRKASQWGLTDKEYAEEKRDFQLQMAQEVADTSFAIFNGENQRRLDAAISSIERERDQELSNKDLTESQKAQINAKYDAKVKAEKLKAWKAEQAAAIAQVIINGAIAVAKVTGQLGVAAPFAIPAIVAGTALQVATIAAQKPPEYAKGGLLPQGSSHAQGGIDLYDRRRNAIVGNIEGGEPILSKTTYANNKQIIDELLYSSQRKAGASIRLNPEILEAERMIRNGGAGAGSGNTPVVNVSSPNIDLEPLIIAINRMEEAQNRANDKNVILSTRLLEEELAKQVKLKNSVNA